MKFQKTAVIGSTLFLMCGAALSALPFYPQAVETLIDQQAPPKDYTRLSIRLSLGAGQLEKDVQLGNLTVCSDSACYRPRLSKSAIDLYDTSNGEASLVVEMAIPFSSIKSVHLEGAKGLKTIDGDITLLTPLALEKNFQGAELLLLLKKSVNNSKTNYAPYSAKFGLTRSTGTSIYYDPRTPATKRLPLGLVFSIPAGATREPQIFNVAVHDTGDAFPLVDIFPEVELAIPASIKFSSAEVNAGEAVSKSLLKQSPTEQVTNSIDRTGVIRINKLEKSVSVNNSIVQANAAAVDGCISTLSLEGNKQIISSALLQTGIVYLDWCADKPPFVHIAVANQYYSQYSNLYIVTGSLAPNENYNYPALNLQRITAYASITNSQVVINGFTWDGSYGLPPTGGVGFANGFVQQDPVVYGLNRVGGGVNPSAAFAGNKLAVIYANGYQPQWGEGATAPVFGVYANGARATILSSSTSIVKANICSSDSLLKGWSAFGTTPGNPNSRMIFMSSTSGSTTSVLELCPVFQALGSNYAIRMDGGPSTGMIIDGAYKNPLTGTDSFIFGNARFIAYGIRFGTRPGVTPAPTAITRVRPPKNPCVVNPAACV